MAAAEITEMEVTCYSKSLPSAEEYIKLLNSYQKWSREIEHRRCFLPKEIMFVNIRG